MVFSSVIFLCLFLPIVLGGYYLLPKREAKNLWLIAASLLFYAFSGLWYVLLLLFSVFCNYLAGLFVSGRKGVLYVAVAVNLGVLGVFKYLTFLVRTVNQLPGVAIAVPSIVLPVGISFFTFQGLSYVIDVYRNERLKSTRFRDVLLYIALFGVMLFLMLWEARGRYLFGFVAVLLLLAAHGALQTEGGM